MAADAAEAPSTAGPAGQPVQRAADPCVSLAESHRNRHPSGRISPESPPWVERI